MTYSDYSKMFKQLEKKPNKMKKYDKHNAPKDRSTVTNTKKCQR